MDINSFLNQYNISSWQESESLEWKLSTREHKEIVQSLVAFANKDGGVLVCGVDDKGAVYGQDISDATVREISQTILANTEEKIYPSIDKITLDGKSVLVIQVSGSPLRPHSAYGRAYIRVGSSSNLMAQSEYHLMLGQKQNGGGADRDLLPDLQLDEIDEKKLKDFVEQANNNRNLNLPVFADSVAVLTSLELMSSGVLNKGATLLFGKNPQKYLPQAEFRVAHFEDDTRNKFLSQKVFTGDLFSQFSAVLSFAKERLPNLVDTKIEGSRVLSTVPMFVIQELVANALVHRDYHDQASSYFNIIGDEYFEISNSGHLPAPKITPQTLHLAHPSIPVNRRVARVFFLAGIIEQWGEGTRRVVRALKERNMPEPVWESARGTVRVVVRFK